MKRRFPVLLAAAALAGCAGAPPRLEEPTVQITRDFYVELWVVGEENLAALYRVNQLGQIGFGGGTKARDHVITWVGTISPEQLQQLQALVQEHGWCTEKIPSVPEPRQRVNRIQMQCQGHYRRMTVRGASPDVEPLRAFLDRAARERLEPQMKALELPPG